MYDGSVTTGRFAEEAKPKLAITAAAGTLTDGCGHGVNWDMRSAGGMASALYQHFVAAKSASCNLTFADKVIGAFSLDARWPDMFEVRANCADAATNLLGVPYEFWSLALFAMVAAAALWVIRSDA